MPIAAAAAQRRQVLSGFQRFVQNLRCNYGGSGASLCLPPREELRGDRSTTRYSQQALHDKFIAHSSFTMPTVLIVPTETKHVLTCRLMRRNAHQNPFRGPKSVPVSVPSSSPGSLPSQIPRNPEDFLPTLEPLLLTESTFHDAAEMRKDSKPAHAHTHDHP